MSQRVPITETVIDYQTGEARHVIRVQTRDEIHKIRTTRTTTAKPTPKAPREKPDELKLIVEYHQQQEAQRAGPPDTMSYRDRLKMRMMTRTHEEPPPPIVSLVGRWWRVGDLEAVVVADDGGDHVQYQYGAPRTKTSTGNASPCRTLAPLHSISRDVAEQYITARKRTTAVAPTSVTSGRTFASTSPSGKKATNDLFRIN